MRTRRHYVCYEPCQMARLRNQKCDDLTFILSRWRHPPSGKLAVYNKFIAHGRNKQFHSQIPHLAPSKKSSLKLVAEELAKYE